MTLNEQIESEYLTAYKAHEVDKVAVLRLIKSAIKNRLFELKRPGGTLSDQEILEVIIKQAKQRQDSIDQFMAAGRQDLADKEKAELEILKTWMPKTFSKNELIQAIKSVITETGASSMKDMGKVMKILTAKYTGQLDAKEASALVKELLSNS